MKSSVSVRNSVRVTNFGKFLIVEWHDRSPFFVWNERGAIPCMESFETSDTRYGDRDARRRVVARRFSAYARSFPSTLSRAGIGTRRAL